MTQNYHYNGLDDAGGDNNAGDDTVDTDWRWEARPADVCNISLWLTPVVTGVVCCRCLTPAATGRCVLPFGAGAIAVAAIDASGSPAVS